MGGRRDNILRAVRFGRPDIIPMSFHINAACWHHYPPDALHDLMASHPLLFPGFVTPSEPALPEYGSNQRAGVSFEDAWGCIWETTDDGITGTVTGHPLGDWEAFRLYQPPDPAQTLGLGPVDWADVAQRVQLAKTAGELATGGLTHGHTFMTLANLRGYENLIFDMADDDPRLYRLIQVVEDFNMGIVRRFADLGVDLMGYAEDLGMQVGPMISPEHLRKYIKPSYQRLMTPAREADCIVHMHSDGDVRQLVDDLVDGGVEVMNLQDLVNGIDWIKEHLAGRVCIELDIDRQSITRFGTPAQIDALIRQEVETLGSKQGGLMMVFGLYPGTPLENVVALMDAMERYAGHFA